MRTKILNIFIPSIIVAEALMAFFKVGGSIIAAVTIIHILLFCKLSTKFVINNTVNSLFILLVYSILQGFLLQVELVRMFQPIALLLLYILLINTVCQIRHLFVYQNLILTLIVISFLGFFLPWSFMGDNRLIGLFGNPNRTAFMALFVFMYILLLRPKGFIKIASYVLFTLIIILTTSRGVVMALFLAFFAGYLINKAKHHIYIISLLLIGSVLLISLFAVDILSYLIECFGLVSDSRLLSASYNGRDFIWEQAMMDFKESPIIGKGFVVGTYESEGGLQLNFHNGFINILSRMGLLGMFLSIVFLLSLLYDISHISDTYNRSIAVMTVALIISLSTNDSLFMSLSYFFYMGLFIIFLSFKKIIRI